MKTLTAERSCVVVKISDLGASNLPLEEQMRSLLGAAPYLVLDMDGIQITSMMLGELVNLYKSFEQRWGKSLCNGHHTGTGDHQAGDAHRQACGEDSPVRRS